MSLNELGEKSRATIILGKFENNPKSNSNWLIFFENVLYWSKFKARSHDVLFSWPFDPLLINSRYLVIGVYFSPRQRNLHGKPIMKYQLRTCFWYWYSKKLFFDVKLKLFEKNNFYFFAVSWTHSHKQPFADVLRNRFS